MTRGLSGDEVLAAYDRVSALYPFVPPLSLWRAWECAAYAHHRLEEPVLDVGCGDGAFFRFLWPDVRRVVGVEQDPAVAEKARACGVYERVLELPAHALPDGESNYGSAFANCSLEHMDDLDPVLRAIHRALRPGGRLLCSVVTDRFVSWMSLPPLLARLGQRAAADAARRTYLDRHHLANPLTTQEWRARLEGAGFRVDEHISIVPEITARVFLLLDELWHVPDGDGELAQPIEAFLARRPRFPTGFGRVLDGLLQMESADEPACGAVFVAERPA